MNIQELRQELAMWAIVIGVIALVFVEGLRLLVTLGWV
jgi:hypothetical protein